MAKLVQDLRYSIRNLRRNPVFTVVALLSLALGIGCNTAIFSLLDQVMLRRLPVTQPGRLVVLSDPGPYQGRHSSHYSSPVEMSYPMYRDIRDGDPVFDGVLARLSTELSLAWQGSTEQINGELVSGNYFDVLGVSAALGRPFHSSDDVKPGGHPVAVLSHGFWVRRFAANPGILNQNIRLNSLPMTVVGIAPPGFQGVSVGDRTDVFVPMMMKAQMTPGWDDLENRRSIWVNVLARLKPGITMQQAQTASTAFWHPILQMELDKMGAKPSRFRQQFASKQMRVLPGATGLSGIREHFSTSLIVLMIMVGLLLLIACANVANLLLARAAARQREVAIRLALGSGRGRLIRQLLTESVLLSVAGGLLGLLVADWSGTFLLHFFAADDGAQTLSAGPDPRVLGFTAALSILTGLLFGLMPALQTTRHALADTLKEQAGNLSSAASQLQFRKALVVAQIALSLLLLVGAGLFARSLVNLRHTDTGFRTDHMMTFGINPELNAYTQVQMRSFYKQLRENIAALPGVRMVTLADMGVLNDSNRGSNINVEGHRDQEGEDTNVNRSDAGPGYMATLGIPIIAGRDFTEADMLSTEKVGIINEKMAREFFGGGPNAIGRHFGWGGGNKAKADIVIIGVVRDGKYSSIRQVTPRFVYTPYTELDRVYGMTFFVRTAQDPVSLTPALRRAVANLDPNLPVHDVKTMDRTIEESVVFDRIIAQLSTFFGILATLLASIGLYGVMAYNVTRRTREIGVRIALGADRRSVMGLVMAEVVKLAAVGLVIAIPVSVLLGRLVESQLYGLKGTDPWVVMCAAVLMATIALVSGYIPAWRASRVDPIVALRWE